MRNENDTSLAEGRRVPRLRFHCRPAISFMPTKRYASIWGFSMPKSVNKKQVGGWHYKQLRPQPWDVIVAWGMGFLDGNALKYLARWRSKGGVQDLEKAVHYIEKLIDTKRRHHENKAAPAKDANR